MRKPFSLFFLTICALLSSPLLKGSDPVVIPIIVENTSMSSEVLHRAPAQVPITCVLDTGGLRVTFLADLGFVSVEIENQTSGEYNQMTVNALAGPMTFPISGTAGQWAITFTLSSGVKYIGEFIL